MRARTLLAAGLVICLGAAGGWYWLTETDGGARFVFGLTMGEAAKRDGIRFGAVGYGEGGLVVRDLVVDGDGGGGVALFESAMMVLTGYGPLGTAESGAAVEFRDFSFTGTVASPFIESGAATAEVTGRSAVLGGVDLPVFVATLHAFQKSGRGIENLSAERLRVEGLQSVTEGIPGSMQVALLTFDDIRNGVIESYRFEDMRFTGVADVTVKSGSARHIDLTPYGDPEMSDLLRSSVALNRIEEFVLSDIAAHYQNQPVYTIDAVTYRRNDAWRGLTTDADFAIENMAVEVGSLGDAQAGMPPLEVLRIDVSGHQVWDVEAGRAGLRPLVVEAEKIGRVEMQMDLAGLPAGDKAATFDFSLADLLAVSLEKVVVGVSYDETVDQLIEATAQKQERGRQGTAELMAAIAGMRATTLGDAPMRQLGQAIKTFIAEPGKTFVVELSPAAPIPFLQFTTLGQMDPAEMERKLAEMLGLRFSVR